MGGENSLQVKEKYTHTLSTLLHSFDYESEGPSAVSTTLCISWLGFKGSSLRRDRFSNVSKQGAMALRGDWGQPSQRSGEQPSF